MNQEMFAYISFFGLSLYMIYRFWKKILKTILVIIGIIFILGVIQVKKTYDNIFNTPKQQKILKK